MFPSEYDTDISWISECQPSACDLYAYSESELTNTSFEVEIDGTMHADFYNYEDIEFSKKMSVTNYKTESMSGSGTYRQTGGVIGAGDTVFGFTYTYPDLTKYYTSPYIYDSTINDNLLDLTMPFAAHLVSSSVEYMEDNSAIATLEYNGELMNEYSCGILSSVLPDDYKIYWAPNDAYADQSGIISATIKAEFDENRIPVSIEVNYVLNGGIQNISLLEGTTTYVFSITHGDMISSDSPERIYADILNIFYDCIRSGWAKYNETPSLYSDKLSFLFPMYYSDPSNIDKIGYSFIDLNKDGVEELLIGMDTENETQSDDLYQNMIYDLYTYMNGEIVHIATSGERFTYQLCEDNTIYYWGSGGAASASYYHYQLNSAAPNLLILEGVYSEPDENWENVYWYHSTSGIYNPETNSHEGEEATMISEDEATAIREAWPQTTSNFSLTYFSEYIPQNADTESN